MAIKTRIQLRNSDISAPCKCLDLDNIQGWGDVGLSISYDKVKGYWDYQVNGDINIDFDCGFECSECGELWTREQVIKFASV